MYCKHMRYLNWFSVVLLAVEFKFGSDRLIVSVLPEHICLTLWLILFCL
jgi:hypothetical protein